MANYPLKILNNETLIALVGDESSTLQKFQREFLLQSKQCLKTLVHEFNTQNFPSLVETAHYLKTSAKSVGAEQVSDTLQNLEKTGSHRDITATKKLLIQLQAQLNAVRKEVVK